MQSILEVVLARFVVFRRETDLYKKDFQNLGELLEDRAKKFARKPFLIFGRRKFTFSEINNLSSYLASFLNKEGVGFQDRVCIWMSNLPWFVISYFAILKIGAIAVPVNSMFKREEAKFLVEDTQAKVLIVAPENIEPAFNIKLRVNSLSKIISFSFNKDVYQEVIDLRDILNGKEEFFKRVTVKPQDIAEILYTSGTTGEPKGACLTHRNLLANIRDCQIAISASSKDVFSCFLPLFHSFASTVCLLFPLYTGSTTVLFRSIRPFKRVLKGIFKNRVSVFVGVPSIFSALKEVKLPLIFRIPLLKKFFNPLRVAISGASALACEVIPAFEKKFGIPLLEGYGLTEASPVVSLSPLKGKRKPGSIGKVFPSQEVKVVDSQGKELPVGEVGELIVKGPNVMKGYFKRVEDTQKTIRGGWLYTGDLAKIDEEGFIYIVGRIKEMINVRGLNVYPREIEEVIYQLSPVKECAVVGINHPRKGEVPLVFIAFKEGESLSSQEIFNYLKDRLAVYKLPWRIEVRESLPKSSTGKIVKYLLKEEAESKFFKKAD
ncbi:MAG TPA: long-chain-fatty-acid--CoA ligase [Candidatus Omnitrophica bacterium]|nr:MAG: fatty acid--CoA ligase [Candidatus Omnitrophota bacterium]HEC69566.1 long-chain-fatty-acid--CoA ligase [Candidatus Omnitrophota bacterium]